MWPVDTDFCRFRFSFSNKTPLCCLETQNSSAVALIGTIFISETEQKQSILCKCKSLNFNFLFIELLLYKITLQSCWNILFVQCYVPKSYIINSFFFTTAVCIYNFLCVLLHSFVLISAQVSLSHSLRLCKPQLAWHKYIISRRKCAVKIDRLGIGRLTSRSPVRADRAENWLIPVPGHSIRASLLETQTFKNRFQSARFWKQYHYCLCVNYKNVNLWKRSSAYILHGLSIVMCAVFTKWHRHLLAWQPKYRILFYIQYNENRWGLQPAISKTDNKSSQSE